MGFKEKFKAFFDFDEYEEVDESSQSYEQKREGLREQTSTHHHKDNIVSLTSIQNDARMVLCEPTSYDETQSMADHLKKRQSIVVNLQRLDHQTGRRVVDFLSGTVYALNGNIQKLGQQTFLCTPEHVNISGNITDSLDELEQFNRR